MAFTDKIKNNIDKLPSTKLVVDINDLAIEKIDDGLILIYATWSGTAIANFTSTLDLLNREGFQPTLFICDTDNITTDGSISTFGQALGGNGEIFVIQNGHVTEKYFGQNSYADFLNAFSKNHM